MGAQLPMYYSVLNSVNGDGLMVCVLCDCVLDCKD